MFSFVSTSMCTCGKCWASSPIFLYFKENIYFMCMCMHVFRRGSWIPEVTGSYVVLGTEPRSSHRRCLFLPYVEPFLQTPIFLSDAELLH